MSNKEQLNKLEKEISELERLLQDYQDFLNNFKIEFPNSNLPPNSFYCNLIKVIKRNLDKKTNLYLALV